MKLKHVSVLIVFVFGLFVLYKCSPKTTPVPTLSPNNTVPGINNEKYKIPGNNGFDYNDVSRGFGSINIPSFYSVPLEALYGKCDLATAYGIQYYVMAVIAGERSTLKAKANLILYFNSKPSKSFKYSITPDSSLVNDTTLRVLFTDIEGKEGKNKTWVGLKGKVDIANSSSGNIATFTNLTGQNIANISDTIQFSGSVSCN